MPPCTLSASAGSEDGLLSSSVGELGILDGSAAEAARAPTGPRSMKSD